MSNVSSSNQHTNDPREQVMWDIYVSNLANGVDNAYDAAIKAKYSKDHSRNITLQGWFKERKDKLRRKDMLSKAEKVLDKTLDYEPVDSKGKIDVGLLRVQTDVAKTVVTTLGKNDGYSSRNELTGKDGEALPTPILGIYVQPDNSNPEGIETKKED